MSSSPTIVTLTAPLLLGSLTNTYLFGILSVQLYIYYLSFPSDALYLKVLVYSVFTIDTASTIMLTSDTYHWFAKGFGSMEALDNPYLSPLDTPVLGALVAAAVQAFYCYRIVKIERKAWPAALIVVVVIALQLAGGFWLGIKHFRLKSFKNATHTAVAAAYLVFGGAALADTIIAVTMTVLLVKRRSDASHNQTRKTVRKIMLLTAETNVTSTIVALATMLLFLIQKGTYFTFPSIILGKVYSNSLLLILNNRAYLGEGSQGSVPRNVVGSHRSQPSRGLSIDANPMGIVRLKERNPELDWKNGIRVEVNSTTHLDVTDKGSGWAPNAMDQHMR